LEEIGKVHGASIAQTAIGWVLGNTAVTSAPIGANTTAQLEDTIKEAQVKLTNDEKKALGGVTARQ
jgi:aryl-alcohol dehydrogenase-like predicted oxidoreductase